MKFRGHDLRRTAASLMVGGGVPRVVVSKILNHVEHRLEQMRSARLLAFAG